MSFNDVVPVLLVALPAAIGVVTYAWQEHIRRRTALAERRQVLYESLIGNLVDLLTTATAEERSNLLTEIEKGWLFASDDVLRASYYYLSEYDRLCCSLMENGVVDSEAVLAQVRSNAETRRKLGALLEAVFLEMRQESRTDTKLEAPKAIENFEIYLWGALSPARQPPGWRRVLDEILD
jgi:hypothetical protein